MRSVFGRAVNGSSTGRSRGCRESRAFTRRSQFLELVIHRRESHSQKPVLVEYPYKGKWAVAFLTGGWSARLAPEPRRKYCTVFMPTTPNPSTGFLMIVPVDQVRPLAISVKEKLKLILSGGLVK
jgi:uncharacterized membrane protein